MIVGRQQQVEAHVAQLLGITVGSAEAGIARIGLAAQRTLEVGNGQVGPGDVVLEVLKAGAVVIGAIGLLGRGNLWRMLHGIAYKRQVDHGVALEQRHDRQEQYGEQLHTLCAG